MRKCEFSMGLIVLALICFCVVAAAAAEEPPVLEQVVVTASRVKEKKKEVTLNVSVINEEEIRNSSAKDLGDLLAEKGIGHIQKYPGTLTSVGIRAFRTETHGNDLESYVLVLVDGRRAGTGNLAKILTKNIERIEIIRGPASVQYGSAAMGGVINVITKRGSDKPGIFLEGGLGSFGYEEGSVGFSGKLEQIDFSGSLTSESMGDYDTATGDRYRNTGFDGKKNISLNVGFEFLPQHRLGVIYHLFKVDHAGSPGYLSNNDLDDYSEKKNESIDLYYEGAISGNTLSWKLRYFFGEDNDKWYDPVASNPDGWDDGIPSEQSTDQKGAQAQISYNFSGSTLTAGFDWVNYEVDATWDPKRSEYNNPAYFLMGKTKLLGQRLIFNGGIRYDQYKVKIKEGQGGTEKDSHLISRVGLAYFLTQNVKFRASYGEAFKMPSAKQLAGDFGTWVHYVGNPRLDPEKSKTYEGGMDVYYGPLSTSLTYFHTDFEDKIQTTTTAGGDVTWRNIGEATIAGLEGELSGDIGQFLDLDFEIKPYLSIVYLTKYKDEETDEDLRYVSDKTISHGITISDTEGFSATLDFTYTGKQRIDDWESGWPPPVITKGDFTVANFSIAKKILDFSKLGKVTLKGEIRNLFDKDYSYVKGYPMPGRSFFLSFRYDF